MNIKLENGGVALAGVVTSIATAVAVVVFYNLTGFNVFGFSIWVVIPAGAVMCGFAAASGYFFAAKYLHLPPSRFLLLQMVVVTALTQISIYWLEYKTLTVNGMNVSHYVPFSEYLSITLTSAHLKIGRALQSDGGEVGSFGYWLAVIDFVGFLAGGVSVYFKLKGERTCGDCQKYLQTLTTKKDSFADPDAFAAYYDNEFTHPVHSQEFSQHVGTEHSAGKAQKGTVNMETRVLGCPSCGLQAVSEKIQIYNGRDWKDLNDLSRFVPMPRGVNVAAAYR